MLVHRLFIRALYLGTILDHTKISLSVCVCVCLENIMFFKKIVPFLHSIESPFKNLIEYFVSLLVLEGRLLCVVEGSLFLSPLSLPPSPSLSPSFLSPLLFMWRNEEMNVAFAIICLANDAFP